MSKKRKNVTNIVNQRADMRQAKVLSLQENYFGKSAVMLL